MKSLQNTRILMTHSVKKFDVKIRMYFETKYVVEIRELNSGRVVRSRKLINRLPGQLLDEWPTTERFWQSDTIPRVKQRLNRSL